jgi:serine protease Do
MLAVVSRWHVGALACLIWASLAAGTRLLAQENSFLEIIAQAQPKLVKVSGARAGNVDGYASGMVVSPDGKVLTTQGVFLDGNQVQVILADGSRHSATVIRRDRRLQMSLLDLGIPTPEYFDLGQAAAVEPGDWVAAISNAFKVADKDEPLSVMMGVVSLATTIDAKRNQRDVAYSGPLVLIDAITSNPGAAGGVVLNAKGQVVGMIGRIIDSSETNTRLNYAVPADEVSRFVRGDGEERAAVGEAIRTGEPLDLGLKIFTLSGRSAPPYVDRVVPGGPAQLAGIQADDLIVSIAGDKVTTVGQYQSRVAQLTDAEEVVLVVARKKELIRALIPSAENHSQTAGRMSETKPRGQEARLVAEEPPVPAVPTQNEGDADPPVAGDLASLPALARAAMARIRPSIVTLESFGGVTATEGVIGGIRSQGEGNTTGLIVSADGLVVTSLFNFVRNPRIITVIMADGQRRVATILGRDLSRNLCLLQLQDVQDLPTPEWIPATEIEVGQYAISLGVGYGDTRPALSVGVISAVNRIGGRAIQTDANISPANYGGPLVDLEGRVFGVCVPLSPGGMSASAGVEWYDSGIGFAVSLDSMEWWIERLRVGQDIYPGIIGVTVVDNPIGPGLKIVRTIPDSAASQAGLQPDDILLEAAGHPLRSQADLLSRVKRMASGDRLPLTLGRGEERIEVEIFLTPHPDSQPKSLIPGLPPLEELR